jgi:hypothetical protein
VLCDCVVVPSLELSLRDATAAGAEALPVVAQKER